MRGGIEWMAGVLNSVSLADNSPLLHHPFLSPPFLKLNVRTVFDACFTTLKAVFCFWSYLDQTMRRSSVTQKMTLSKD